MTSVSDSGLKVKVVIFGGREYNNKEVFNREVGLALDNWGLGKDEVEVVEGGARGADRLAYEYAVSRGISCKRFNADWDKLGKSAGHVRNKEMAKYCEGQYGIAFWDGKSKGTGGMLKLCEKYGIEVVGIMYES